MLKPKNKNKRMVAPAASPLMSAFTSKAARMMIVKPAGIMSEMRSQRKDVTQYASKLTPETTCNAAQSTTRGTKGNRRQSRVVSQVKTITEFVRLSIIISNHTQDGRPPVT